MLKPVKLVLVIVIIVVFLGFFIVAEAFSFKRLVRWFFGREDRVELPVSNMPDPINISTTTNTIKATTTSSVTSLKAVQYLNVAYKSVSGVDRNLLSLDIYAPSRTSVNQKLPAMIYVHGGGWTTGDKDNKMEYKPGYFNNLGYVFISVNYRLTPAVEHPTNTQDVADAIAYIYKNANAYGIDNTKISLIGHSAGAQLVSLVSTNEQFLQAAGLNLSQIKCVVSNDTEGYDISDDMDKQTYQAQFANNSSTMIQASAIKNISASEDIPDFLVITRGTKARISEANEFKNTLTKYGYYAQLLQSTRYDHEGVNDAVGNPSDKEVTSVITSFLKSRCQ